MKGVSNTPTKAVTISPAQLEKTLRTITLDSLRGEQFRYGRYVRSSSAQGLSGSLTILAGD